MKAHAQSVVESHIHEFTTKTDTFELIDKDGNPLGSGWAIAYVDKPCVDILQTRDPRGPIYI